eukprot:COSAG06_NODE_1096_length_10720_cov_195.594521_7_plen_244_part_00
MLHKYSNLWSGKILINIVRAEYTRREIFPSRFGEALHQALARVVSGDDAGKALVQALALLVDTSEKLLPQCAAGQLVKALGTALQVMHSMMDKVGAQAGRRAQDKQYAQPPAQQAPGQQYAPGYMPHGYMQYAPPHTYLRRCRQRRQLCAQLERASRGMRVRWHEVEGGKEGVEYGPDARLEQFRHLVFRNRGGRPEVVREGLPDERSDMNLERWFQLAVDTGSSDLGTPAPPLRDPGWRAVA